MFTRRKAGAPPHRRSQMLSDVETQFFFMVFYGAGDGLCNPGARIEGTPPLY